MKYHICALGLQLIYSRLSNVETLYSEDSTTSQSAAVGQQAPLRISEWEGSQYIPPVKTSDTLNTALHIELQHLSTMTRHGVKIEY